MLTKQKSQKKTAANAAKGYGSGAVSLGAGDSENPIVAVAEKRFRGLMNCL